MQVKRLRPDVTVPYRATTNSAAFDIYMPESGYVSKNPKLFKLGFALTIPEGFVGILAPRSSTGTKQGLCLTNTVGVIDSDYRGEVMAMMHILPGFDILSFTKDARLIQLMVIPIYTGHIEVVTGELDSSDRGSGGFGSTN